MVRGTDCQMFNIVLWTLTLLKNRFVIYQLLDDTALNEPSTVTFMMQLHHLQLQMCTVSFYSMELAHDRSGSEGNQSHVKLPRERANYTTPTALWGRLTQLGAFNRQCTHGNRPTLEKFFANSCWYSTVWFGSDPPMPQWQGNKKLVCLHICFISNCSLGKAWALAAEAIRCNVNPVFVSLAGSLQTGHGTKWHWVQEIIIFSQVWKVYITMRTGQDWDLCSSFSFIIYKNYYFLTFYLLLPSPPWSIVSSAPSKQTPSNGHDDDDIFSLWLVVTTPPPHVKVIVAGLYEQLYKRHHV